MEEMNSIIFFELYETEGKQEAVETSLFVEMLILIKASSCVVALFPLQLT
jgi:hypothetical protein